MGFRDQVVVVTGAGSGVGRAIALALAGHGATLCLVGRRGQALDAVAEESGGAGSRTVCLPADLTEDGQIAALQARLAEEVGRVDVLVHCAGIFSLGSMEDAPSSDLDRHYWINTRAPYALTRALLPMLLRQRGQVVFMNSSVGLTARGGVGAYAASKHALRALADSLRDEVNARGVRVLSVYLGRTATPMQAQVHALEGKAYHPERLLQPEDVAAVVVHTLALPSTVEVTEIHIRPMLKPQSTRDDRVVFQPSPFA